MRRAPSSDLGEFYRRIHQIVARAHVRDELLRRPLRRGRQAINFPYFVDEVDLEVPDPALWEPFGVGNARGSTAYVLRTGQDAAHRARALSRAHRRRASSSLWRRRGRLVGAPLRAEGRAIGAIVVQTYKEGELYEDGDVELLTFVAQHVAQALTRVRAIDEIRQRNAELAIINDIGGALAKQVDFQAMSTRRRADPGDLRIEGATFRRHRRSHVRARSVPVRDRAGDAVMSEPIGLGEGLTSIVIRLEPPTEDRDDGGAGRLGAV